MKYQTRLRQVRVLCAFSAFIFLAACASLQKNGMKREAPLMSADAEIALGREVSGDVLRQLGKYDDDVLQGYIQRIGEQVARYSDQPNLIFHFWVVDTDEVNAFSLPGGYVYLSRGLLAYLNSEADIAAVLAHEIAHVNAHHAIKQRALLARPNSKTGFAVGTVFLPALSSQESRDLFALLGDSFIRGYGRDVELETYRLGAEYMAKAGYDPSQMLKLLSVLKQHEEVELQHALAEGREPNVYHGVFTAAPSLDARLQEVIAQATKIATYTNTSNFIDAARFFESIDGMVFGDSAIAGIRHGRSYYQLDQGYTLTFPQGWRIQNHGERVVAFPLRKDVYLELSVKDRGATAAPGDFAKAQLELENITDEKSAQVNSLPIFSATARMRTAFGHQNARVSVIFLGDKAIVAVAAARNDSLMARYAQDCDNSVVSFHAVSDDEKKLAKPATLKVITANDKTRFELLAEKAPNPPRTVELLRLLNQLYPNGQPTPGMKVKVVE